MVPCDMYEWSRVIFAKKSKFHNAGGPDTVVSPLINSFWPLLLKVFPSSLNVTIMVVGSCPYLGIISSPTYLESLVSSSPSTEPRRCRPQPQLHFRPRFRSPEHVARDESHGYLATADKISGDIWRCYKDQWQRNVRHGSFYCPSG